MKTIRVKTVDFSLTKKSAQNNLMVQFPVQLLAGILPIMVLSVPMWIFSMSSLEI